MPCQALNMKSFLSVLYILAVTVSTEAFWVMEMSESHPFNGPALRPHGRRGSSFFLTRRCSLRKHSHHRTRRPRHLTRRDRPPRSHRFASRVAGKAFELLDLTGPSITVVGGSSFGPNTSSKDLRASKCTSGPIVEDKSNYWTPTLYFQWANGSFTSVDGTVSVKYLFKPGEATPFPDDFKMLAGSPTSRSKNESDFQSDETFLCLNPFVQASRHDTFPALQCPGGLRSQVVRSPSPHSSTETNSHPTDIPKLLGWKGAVPFLRDSACIDLTPPPSTES